MTAVTLEPSEQADTLVVALDGIAIGRVRLRKWCWGILPMNDSWWPTGSYPTEHAAAQAVLRAYQIELRRASARLAMRRRRTA